MKINNQLNKQVIKKMLNNSKTIQKQFKNNSKISFKALIQGFFVMIFFFLTGCKKEELKKAQNVDVASELSALGFKEISRVNIPKGITPLRLNAESAKKLIESIKESRAIGFLKAEGIEKARIDRDNLKMLKPNRLISSSASTSNYFSEIRFRGVGSKGLFKADVDILAWYQGKGTGGTWNHSSTFKIDFVHTQDPSFIPFYEVTSLQTWGTYDQIMNYEAQLLLYYSMLIDSDGDGIDDKEVLYASDTPVYVYGFGYTYLNSQIEVNIRWD
ncbi:hypothetical protein [Pedobacter sp. MW01-1-1]|uniref:hypothetical protein n=1 Tax=Pedobacter sp. MW01-1-1 TaxID=3383027 RepID=UPI003FF130E3